MTIVLMFSAQGSFATPCSKISFDEFNQLVQSTKEKFFPELSDVEIYSTTFKSRSYFLQAQPSLKKIFNQKLKRTYEIQVNRQLLDCAPSNESLTAILIHEIEHVVDYNNVSGLEIVLHGIKYSTNRTFRANYERETDLKSLARGRQPKGLIEYRNWVYQWLNEAALKKKKLYYLTPEEIEEWSILNP